MTYPEESLQSTSSGIDELAADQVVMHAVVPLTECPHLREVREIPADGLNAHASCSECQSPMEEWICLTCYEVNCGRYVSGHAVHHQMRTGHSLALSLTDLSVWCYPCESYVHNEVLIPAKSAAHRSKFGVDIGAQDDSTTAANTGD